MISILKELEVQPGQFQNERDLVRWAKDKKILPRNQRDSSKVVLKDGEYKVPMKEKPKVKQLNPRTGRLKNKIVTKFLVTDISPKDRTFKNLPRYAPQGSKKRGKPKVRFQDWLELKKSPVLWDKYNDHSWGWGSNGRCYGWSHRAIGEFYVGKEIKPGTIGNKYEYGEEINKRYNDLEQVDRDKAEAYRKSLANFKTYTIQTDKEAEQHAKRFAEDVS